MTPDPNRTRELLEGFTNPPGVAALPDGRIAVTVTRDFWKQATEWVLSHKEQR